MKNKTKKHLFKVGNYVIGDPCYFIADENWGKVLEDTGFFGAPMVDAKPPKDWTRDYITIRALNALPTTPLGAMENIFAPY